MKTIFVTAIAAASVLVAVPLAQAGDKSPVRIELAVKLDSGSIGSVAASTDSEPGRTLVNGRGVHAVTVELLVDDPEDPKKRADAVEDAIKQVEKDKRVLWAVELDTAPVRDDRFHAWPATAQTGAELDDIEGQPAFAELQLEEVHAHATGEGTIVAVLDTGVQQWHPLVRDQMILGYDFVNGDDHAGEYADGRDNDNDGRVDEAHGHGTFVAGVIAQIAPDAVILPVRVLDAEGDGHLYAVIDGIDYAIERGADVINMSFGLDQETGSKALEEAVKRAERAGVIVVAAAGNAGDDEKRFPASLKDVVSVTALGDGNENVADFATRGKWVTVAAPGFGIVSSTTEGEYARWAGTSMATPVVTAGYALVIEAHPELKADKIGSILLKAARKMLIKDQASAGSLDLLDAVS